MPIKGLGWYGCENIIGAKSGSEIEMMAKKIIALILLCVGVLSLCAGCNDSYAEKKQDMKLKWDADVAKAKVPLAIDLFEDDRVDEAEQLVVRCIRADKDLHQGHLLMAKIHLHNDRFSKAETSLEKALKLDESLDQAWYLLGQTAYRNGKINEAFEYYGKALELNAGNKDYIVAISDLHFQSHNYETAISFLDDKIRQHSGLIELRLEKADMLVRMGQTDEAVKVYNQALLLRPDDAAVLQALGYCYIIDKQWPNAAKTFERLCGVTTGARRKSDLQLVAICSMNSQDYNTAVGCYDRMSVEQRDDAEFWLQMGQAALGANDADRAFWCGKKALSLKSGYCEAVTLIGCAQYAKGDCGLALKTFESNTPADIKAKGFNQLMIARCLDQLGDLANAKRAYKKALEMNPDSDLANLVAKEKGIK